MGDFKKLTVWQRAHTVAVATLQATKTLPRDDRSGLAAQMCRAAVSITANIAESAGRGHPRDQCRFLLHARGSARELESHLLLARDCGLLSSVAFQEISQPLDEVQRMLTVMVRRVARAGRSVIG